MITHTLHASGVHVARPDRRWAVRLFRGVLNRFLLLPLGVAIALVWANTDAEAYFRFSHSWAFAANQIGMAFFLALIAQEVFEGVMPGGALHLWKHWSSPLVGAIGGLIGSLAAFLLYVGVAHEQMLVTAWPVAVAIDIGAGYYLLRLIYPRRHTVVTFLLLMAVVTDLVAVTVVSTQAPDFQLHGGGFALLLGALLIAALLRWSKVRRLWPYWLACGTVSWFALYWMGVHPAFALLPIVPFLPHDPRRGDVFADRPDHDPIHFEEHEWHAVAQVALFLFGLVNGGVILKAFDTGTWAVLVAAVAGRPLGILIVTALAVSAGLHLPRRMHWRDLIVVSLATTSGFTFALFLASTAVPPGAVAEQITVGALATTVGALLTLIVAWSLRVGRFKPRV
jgi:NhaA family Na+:H+ antiporter